MSSNSVLWSAPRTPKPAPKMTTSSPAPPSLTREPQQLQRVKTERKSGGSSSSSNKEQAKEPDAPLSLQGQVFQVLAMVAVACLVATGGFKTVEWMQQQLKPFCDSYGTTKAGISDDCIPCPQKGSCRDGVLECLVGFRRVGKSCVEDKEIDQTAEQLMGYLTKYLCGLAAHAVCDGASGAVRLTDDEAQTYVKEQGTREHLKLDDKSWLLVWEKMAKLAEASIAKLNELEGKREFICPSELVQWYKPVRCRIREWIWANLFILAVLSPVIEDLVREDSRIDQFQKKVKGEMKIAWEWQVEGALRTPNVKNKVLGKARSPMGTT